MYPVSTRGRATSLRVFKARPNAAVRIFCFPHAGAGASLYREWAFRLPEWIEVWAVQLPGRQDRLGEAPLVSSEAILAEVTPELEALMDKPYALFGPSMGAFLAHGVAVRAGAMGKPPLSLFVAAQSAPHLPQRRAPIHRLGDADFMRELVELKGMPDEILGDPELLSFFLPLLRADFQVSETHREKREALQCPIHVFGGTNDAFLDVSDLHEWRALTKGSFRVTLLEGGHFFFRDHLSMLLSAIERDVASASVAQGRPLAAAS